MDYKIFGAEFKAAGDRGEYEGYFSIFGNVDDGLDVVHKGAFVKTINERARRVKVFYAHDWSKLIGPPPEVLAEDERGLYARGRLTLDSFWGREVWALMKDGALTEGSIGYEAVKFDFEDLDGKQVRHIREVKLYEISPVPLGMNALTELRAVKSAAGIAAAGAEADLDALTALALSLKEGRVLSGANKEKITNALAALDAAMQALNALMSAAEPGETHSALVRAEVARFYKAISVISNQ